MGYASKAMDGPHVQGVLNLVENLEEDGGVFLGKSCIIGCGAGNVSAALLGKVRS